MAMQARKPVEDSSQAPLDAEFGELVRKSELLANSMQSFFKKLDRSMVAEFQTISDYINKTKDEIGALAPLSLTQHRLPSAGAELEAVVRDTETATFRIMTAAEALLEYAGSDPGRAEVSRHAMDILEACSFQDLSGQRLSKVTALLTLIETRVVRLVQELGVTEEGSDEAEGDQRNRELMLNGPALDGPETTQADIDALFD
jgi:chemotaxis protein CheZ